MRRFWQNRGASDREGGGRTTEVTRKNIAIIGFMGAGKSTTGVLLASRLGMGFVDLDEEIAADAGASIPAIFAAEGEEGFRGREQRALERALQGEERVIACGGGVVLRPENVELLRRRSLVVYISISAAEAARRLRDKAGRPLLEGGDLEERVDTLLGEREMAYREAAHAVIAADGKSPEEVAEEIAEACMS